LLAYATLPLGLALIIISGSVFGVVAARPLWSTSSLPLMFLISAVAAGSALLLLLTVLFWPSKNERDYVHLISILSRLTAWMLLAGIFSASIIGFTTLYGGSPTRTAAMQLILTGPFWWSFWILHVVLGVFVPVLIFFLRGDNPKWAGVGAFLATITFVAVTLNIVIPVLVTPEIQGLATAFVHPKLSFDYTPNLMEWQTILFIFGFGSLLFGLGWRILPIDKKMSEEHN
jgi:protein NrfD